MRAKIKSLYSPDIPDLASYQPESKSFSFLLTLMIGPNDSEGAESFDITICTPTWLLDNNREENVLFLRYHMIVFEYSYERILAVLRKQIETLEAKNWNDLALQVAKIGRWEFEDYRE